MPGDRKFARADAHIVEALMIVQAQDPAGNAAIGGERRCDSGDVAAGFAPRRAKALP